MLTLMISECERGACPMFDSCHGFADCPGRRYAYWYEDPSPDSPHNTGLSEEAARAVVERGIDAAEITEHECFHLTPQDVENIRAAVADADA